jgi:NADH-quinone oxidoreductase subunit L
VVTASRLLPLIPVIPAFSALVLALVGRRLGRSIAGKLASGAVGASFFLAVVGFADVVGMPAGERSITVELFNWIASGSFSAKAALVLDPLSSIMALVVTGVGFLIHVYSLGYMADDRDFSRYFAYLNLFTAAMLLLILAENLLLMFVGWEGVGLSSYLLIGFWFERKAAIDAGMKAFIVNRIGDFGFLLGILMTFLVFGTVSFDEFLPLAPTQDTALLSIIGILLFMGAIGKSAQIPLYVWLPDAMEGPTPVSALIHAATMVTAGVYMVSRTAPLYAEAPVALALVGAMGAVTALFAASIALAQDDLKRTLAYSTISQIGYMFLACGVGAFGVAIFHLVTHAFFKAALFLAAGSVMHAMAGETNIQKMGGLKEKLPITYRTFVIAALALAGIPPLAGFFSKDEILWSAFREGYSFLWAAGVATAFLTAFYIGRVWALVFEGRFRGGAQEARRLNESPPSMTWPLRVLALGSAIIGFIGVPHYSWLEGFLAPYLAVKAAEPSSIVVEVGLMMLSIAVAAGGLLLARHFYVIDRALPERVASGAGSLYRLLRDKYRVDELYHFSIVRPFLFLSRVVLWRSVERSVVDGVFNGSARVIRISGEVLRLSQVGNLRVYIFFLFVGAMALLGWMVLGTV